MDCDRPEPTVTFADSTDINDLKKMANKDPIKEADKLGKRLCNQVESIMDEYNGDYNDSILDESKGSIISNEMHASIVR